MYPKLDLSSDEEREESKYMMLMGLLDLAKCMLLEDDIEAAITVYNDRARPLLPDDFTPGNILNDIMTKLNEKNKYERMIEFFNR